MALTTKPRQASHHRKRQGQHHHHGKSYLQTYWPYLPMLAIVGVGALANRALQGSSLVNAKAGAVIGASQAAGPGSSSRLHNLIGNQSSWILFAVVSVTAVAFTFFIISHWYRLHRLMNKGETYMIRRPWLEIATVAVFTVGFVLTRSAGLPH